METSPEKPFYRIHIFCCVNQRAAGHPRGDCAGKGSVALHAYLKSQAKMMPELMDIRVNQSGCLDRCELGPVLVIYPEGVWYHYRSEQDVDEIIAQHILAGKTVERLQLHNSMVTPPQ
ncbi:MAG: (2Fe-2S) ferredoxin domain-containing protein [Magnetococcales bacterium]|nr:(2Fe-2S) ferredoxin domain-containing protein [Magnetococcales bacterium]NGZ26275.1 (2Fe-2S) ferredoxin domain-containing protein [Magnetococcales bacterium]